MEDSEVDQACFLDARDRLDRNSCFLLGTFHEVGPIACLTNCAGCNGSNLGTMGLGQMPHPTKTCDSSIDRCGIEFFHLARAMTDANGFLLASDDFEAIRDRLGDHHVKTVGPDVERGDGGGFRARCHGASLV